MPDIMGAITGVPKWARWALAGIAGALLLGTAIWFYGHTQFNAGKRVVLERLEKAEADAEIAALEAIAAADGKATERASEFEATEKTLEKVIEDAKADDRNSLDALLGSM